jgi:uncharacterized membrane protein (DUF4010 family)
MPPQILPSAIVAIAEALLIGFLIGAQREASQGEGHPGVRDFVLIALIGAVCGLLQNPWLTVAALASVTAMLAAFYFQVKPRLGITTELAALTTYCLAFLAASPVNPLGEQLAIGLAIVVVGFLEAKKALHKLVRETVTETEFNDTLRFLAIIFIVYPILPEGDFGPYLFLSPRRIWTFVILVSSVSYAGYFLQKFLGARRGLKLTGILGGLASTTAATASLARSSAEAPESQPLYGQAAVLANAMQFPRIILLLYVVSPVLANATLVPLLCMTLAGLLLGLLIGRKSGVEAGSSSLALRNPFRLLPALKLGLLFGLILFASKAASAAFGTDALYWASGLGGSLDADAVALSLSDLLAHGSATVAMSTAGVFLALLANAVVKTVIAFYAGTRAFGWAVAAGFAAMFAAGLLGWLLQAAA